MNTYFLDDYTYEGAIKLYKLYLDSNISELPNSVWADEYGKKRAKFIIKYLIEEILQYSRSEIIHKLTIKTFSEYKLSNMLRILCKNRIFNAVELAYPNEYKEEMFTVQRNYWDEQLIKEEIESISKKINKDVWELTLNDIKAAKKYGLLRGIYRLYDGFDDFFKKNYKRKELWKARHPGEKRDYSQDEEKEMIRHLLEDVLQMDIKDTQNYQYVNTSHFYENHMRFICKKYDYDIKKIIKKYYPDLKICTHKSKTYILTSPEGKVYETINIKLWVEDNINLLNSETTNAANIVSRIRKAARRKNNTYRGWKIERV